jgi:hypothetical protein
MKPESVVILKHYKRIYNAGVCKQASKQASKYSWLAQFCVFPKFSFKTVFLQLEIRKEAAKIKHYVPQQGKERKGNMPNKISLT